MQCPLKKIGGFGGAMVEPVSRGTREQRMKVPLMCYSQPRQQRAPFSLADSLRAWTPPQAPSEQWSLRLDGYIATPELPPSAAEKGAHRSTTYPLGVLPRPRDLTRKRPGSRDAPTSPSYPSGTSCTPRAWSGGRQTGGGGEDYIIIWAKDLNA